MKKTLITLAFAGIVLPLQAAKPKDGGDDEKKKPDPEAVFKKRDADNDGSLTPEEFRKAGMPAEKAEEIFKKKDKDGDGKLSLDEFKATGKKHKKP